MFFCQHPIHPYIGKGDTLIQAYEDLSSEVDSPSLSECEFYEGRPVLVTLIEFDDEPISHT